ncbi:MAG TPA: hypothetical protein PLX85_09720 [Dehalococcoidia bacterium]|nr:hypothetical protein [Dehalococcoidia bacterium]
MILLPSASPSRSPDDAPDEEFRTTSNPEEPHTPKDRDLLPAQQMQYYDQYRSHDRWDRVLRFFLRLGESLGSKGGRWP